MSSFYFTPSHTHQIQSRFFKLYLFFSSFSLDFQVFACVYVRTCVRACVCLFLFFRERERWPFAGDDVSFSILYLSMTSVKKCRSFSSSSLINAHDKKNLPGLAQLKSKPAKRPLSGIFRDLYVDEASQDLLATVPL